jgi:hypothetical protein
MMLRGMLADCAPRLSLRKLVSISARGIEGVLTNSTFGFSEPLCYFLTVWSISGVRPDGDRMWPREPGSMVLIN